MSGFHADPALLMGNGKGVALPFLGGTCGQLGDACGRPELPRRDADEPREVMGERALVREAGEYRSTQPVTSRFRLTSTACNIALWMSQSVASARLGSASRLYLVATTPYHNNGPQVVQSQGRTSKGALSDADILAVEPEPLALEISPPDLDCVANTVPGQLKLSRHHRQRALGAGFSAVNAAQTGRLAAAEGPDDRAVDDHRLGVELADSLRGPEHIEAEMATSQFSTTLRYPVALRRV
jgi:hypothetical protein